MAYFSLQTKAKCGSHFHSLLQVTHLQTLDSSDFDTRSRLSSLKFLCIYNKKTNKQNLVYLLELDIACPLSS